MVGFWIYGHDLLAAKGYARSIRSRQSENERHGEGVHQRWRGTRDLIIAVDQKMNGTGRVSTSRWWRCLAPWRCSKALAGAARPEATEHGKRWVQGQIREGTTADSPMQSMLSGKRWFGPAVMASLSKWKRTAAVMAPRWLSRSGEGRNRGGAARRSSSASWLGVRGGGLERRRRAARAKTVARFWSKNPVGRLLYIGISPITACEGCRLQSHAF
jgi:hypothetical protein